MKKIITILALFLCFTANAENPFATGKYIEPVKLPPIFGAIYYVKQSTGNNANPGTSILPWATVAYAAGHTSSGDLIVLLPGTNTETTTAVLPPGVSLEGTDSATCILKTTVTSTSTALMTLASAEGTNGNQYVSNIKFDGNNLATYWGVYVQGRKNVSINNCTFVNFLDNGISYTGRVDIAEAAPGTYATGNTFYNNRVYNCSRYTDYGEGCLDISGQDGMLIYGNTIVQEARSGAGNGYCIKFRNTGYNKGVKIYNNYLRRAAYVGYTHDFCIEMGNIAGIEVYNNIFYNGSFDTNFQYLTLGGTTYPFSLKLFGNTFTCDFEPIYHQYGIVIEFESNGVIIDSNKFANLSLPILFVPRPNDTIKNITITRNDMQNISYTTEPANGIRFGEVINNIHAYNINIYNNTIVSSASKAMELGISLPQGASSNYHDFNIINNIVQGASVAAIGQAGSTAFSNLKIRYNTLYNNFRSNLPYYVSITPTTGYVFDNSININPNLQGALDTLATGSLSRNSGMDVGLPFTGAAPNRGWWQPYSAPVVDVTAPTVTATNPTNGATGVSTGTTITITFSETMDASTLIAANIFVTGKAGTVTYGSNYATITFGSALNTSTTYTVNVQNVKDAAGNTIATPYTYSFTTGATGIYTPLKLKFNNRRQTH